MGLISEFKAFALRGNVVDMAVGIIIGGAFGAIISSIVSDVLMPLIGVVTGGGQFKERFIALDGGNYGSLEDAKEAGVATITYGNVVDVTIRFVIVAFVLFLLIKAMNRLHKKEAATPTPSPAPSKQEVLLTEIRDLLQRNAKA